MSRASSASLTPLVVIQGSYYPLLSRELSDFFQVKNVIFTLLCASTFLLKPAYN